MTRFNLAPPLHAHQSRSLAGAAGQHSGSQNGWQWSQLVTSAATSTAGTTSGTSGKAASPALRDRKMARLETVLLVSDGALSFRKLAQLASLSDVKEVRTLIEKLNRAYDFSACAFRIEEVAGGYRLLTRPQFAMWLDRLHNRQARAKLSPSMLETLAIVAYRQPITRADIERIRGVQASEMLKQLMERSLIRITGEEDSLGRPFLYGTTRQFLEEYGFGRLDDLPMADSLRRRDEPPEEVVEPEETVEDHADEDVADEDVIDEIEDEASDDTGDELEPAEDDEASEDDIDFDDEEEFDDDEEEFDDDEEEFDDEEEDVDEEAA